MASNNFVLVFSFLHKGWSKEVISDFHIAGARECLLIANISLFGEIVPSRNESRSEEEFPLPYQPAIQIVVQVLNQFGSGFLFEQARIRNIRLPKIVCTVFVFLWIFECSLSFGN